MRYTFTGPDPRPFVHLHHGPTVVVLHEGSVVGPEPLEDGSPGEPLDHVITLQPGDVLEVDHVEVHAWLEPADAETAAAHANLDKPEQLPAKKPELVALAQARGLDDTGTVAELTERLRAASA